MTFGDKIRTIRKMKGLSQDNLAEMLGISVTAYAKIERNETDASNSRIEQIAKAFQMNRKELDIFGENGVFYLNESGNNNGIFIANSSTTELTTVIARLETENKGLAKDNERLEEMVNLLKDKVALLEDKLSKNLG